MNVVPVGRNYQAWVDDVDYVWATSLRWTSCRAGGKVRAMVYWLGRNYPFKQMSRFIAERMYGPLPPDVLVDHKNGITLDNRRENLRLANHSLNGHNRAVSSRKASGLPLGVFCCKKRDRFAAKIKINRRSHYLGTYTTACQASEAYQKAALATMDSDERIAIERVAAFQQKNCDT